MSKNYGINGLGALVELSKGGANLKNNAGVLEARNNADSAMAIMRGADPVSATDFVTKQYLEAAGAIAVIGNIYDSGGSTPASTQFTGAGQEGAIAICNESVGSFTDTYLYRLDTWNTDVATSTWTEIVPSEGNSMAITDTTSGGSPTYTAEHMYIYDADGGTWVDVGSAYTADAITKSFRAALVFGTSSPLAIGTPAANSIVTQVMVDVTEAFDGTAPTLNVGTAGTADLYMDETEIDLTTIGTYIVDIYKLDGGGTAAQAVYVPDSSAAGAATILFKYELI
jgi:hypothetical protein